MPKRCAGVSSATAARPTIIRRTCGMSSDVHTRRTASTVIAAISVLLSFPFIAESPAGADEVGDFYKGKSITLIVSSSAGGGYDTLARTVARFLGRHVPGSPTVIVRNMAGAGGIVAANFLYTNAEKDGAQIGLLQNNTPFEPLLGTKG